MQLPGARTTSIAPSAISADEQPVRVPVVAFPVQPPPPDAFNGELGCVVGYSDVGYSDVDHRSISGNVVGTIRNGLAFALLREVMHQHPIGLSLGQPSATSVFKGSHELFLLRVDRNNRVAIPPEGLHLAVHVAKLGIAVDMLGTLTGFHVGLQGITHFL